MDLSLVCPCALLECLVVVFQVIGVAGLCLCRLCPGTSWSGRGRLLFLVAMVGLGIVGAICGRQDSEFGLFAGGTMTVLLIGMIAGSGSTEPTPTVELGSRVEPAMAA